MKEIDEVFDELAQALCKIVSKKYRIEITGYGCGSGPGDTRDFQFRIGERKFLHIGVKINTDEI